MDSSLVYCAGLPYACRSTSTEALLVLARIPPIELIIEQRIQIEKKGVNSRQKMRYRMLENGKRKEGRSSMQKKAGHPRLTSYQAGDVWR